MADARTLRTDRRDEPRPALGVAPAPLDLTIAIVTWNSERWIERCLQSVEAACAGIPHQIVVYDNHSADATLQRIGPAAEVLRGTENAGFGTGVNRSVAAARGRYVFLLNPDCQLAPGALATLVRYLEEHPEAAAAAPLLSDSSGTSQREFQFRRLPTMSMVLAEVLGLSRLWPGNPITSRYRCRDLDLRAPQPVEQPAAAALLLRRDLFDQIGMFDEQFAPAWFEDVDYCRRLAAAGKRIMVVPDAAAEHFGGASLEHVPFARFVEVWYRNLWLYARKWFTPAQAEALRWAIIAGMLLRIPASIAGIGETNGGRWQVARAYAGVLANAFHRWGLR